MDKRVTGVSDASPVTFPWGRITWLHRGETGAEGLTVGEVIINPGRWNAVHAHPNYEEVLYLISGELDHTCGDEGPYHLKPGMSIRIPKGVKHNARCTSADHARMLVAYDSPYREVTEE
jgi:quercetin dioxygenase-like cupin family protein